MIKREYKNLDLYVYSEKLSNGLEVYIVPNKKVQNIFATYTTRYGGTHNTFIPYGEKEMITVPKGIAHFLEHKMFEQEDGTDALTFFNKNGCKSNASTSPRITKYLFSGPNFFYENLEFLLSFVENPYFTDENVEKEKGIIIEEIHMGLDDPGRRMYNGLLYNALINNPMKYPVIGTDESVRSITKEDLYKCYNTFYHPSNMFLVITGNVDPEKTMDLVRKHEDSRNIKSEKDIILPNYEEPDTIETKEEKIKMDITIPIVGIAFKIRIKDFNLPFFKTYNTIMNAFALRFDSTSLFDERLKKAGLITGEIDMMGINCDDHLLVMLSAETRKPKEVINEIIKEVKNMDISEKEIERRKKIGISSVIMSSDNIFSVNSKIVGDLAGDEKKLDYDPCGRIRNFDTKEAKELLSKINYDNYTIFEIDPIKED